MKKTLLSILAIAIASCLNAQDVKSVFESGKAQFDKFDTIYKVKVLGQQFDGKAMGEALVSGFETYLKALPLDSLPNEKGKIKPKYSKEIIKTLGENYNFLLESGQVLWDSKDFMTCYKCWNLYTSLPSTPNPAIRKVLEGKIQSDSMMAEIIYFQGLAAWQAEELDLALDRFDEAAAKGYAQESLYNYGMSICAQAGQKAEQEKNEAKIAFYKSRIVDFAEKAYQKFGTKDIKYIGFVINDKIEKKDIAGAIAKLNEAIAAEPQNGQLYDVLGVVYENSDGDENEKYNKALEAYLKAVSLNPDDAKSNYDLGRIYYNRASKIYDESQSLSNTQFNKVKEEKIEPLYKQALPYAEKAFAADEDNHDYRQLLKNLYYNLGDEENYSRVK